MIGCGAALRCFIALEIPDDVRGYLCSVIESLRTSGADVKWVERQNIHLTVKFLGACPSEQVEAVMSQLDCLRGKHPQIGASLGALGLFPNRQRPQVVWAGLELRDGAAERLQQEIERRMKAAGFARETRGFRPHLTLGRLRSARRADALIESMEGAAIEPRECSIRSLALMQSHLTPQGAVHRELLSIELG